MYRDGIVVSGGLGVVGEYNKETCEVYRDGRWRPMPDMIDGRAGHSLLVVRDKLFVVGSGNLSSDFCEVYNSSCGKFAALKPPGRERGVVVGAVTMGGKIAFFERGSNAVTFYDVEDDAWT